MTDQSMFHTWAQLLRPLFPANAEFGFKPRRRLICVSWAQDDDVGRPNRSWRSVALSFTNLAWKGYRGARSARRARADLNLISLVKSNLAQFGGEHEIEYDLRPDELRIGVASVDIFPPTAGSSRLAEQSLSAA